MRRSRRKRPPGRHDLASQMLFSMALGMLAALGVILWFQRQVRPMVTALASAELKNTVVDMVNQVVSQDIADGTISYADMVSFQTDQSGQITALTSNLAQVNLMRGQLVGQLTQQLEDYHYRHFSIPVGDLFHSDFFTGKGFRIPVEVLTTQSVSAEFSSDFQEAGVNQTRHVIFLNVTVTLKLLMPGGATTASVDTAVAVADTILLGQVPENYTVFTETESAQEAAENYFNFN